MSSLPPSNPYIAGAALGGKRGFFGREDILHEVEHALYHSTNNVIVLYGQRRIGKTSILLQLQRRLPSPPFISIYFDLMDKARLPVSQVLYQLAVTTADEVGLPPPSQTDFVINPETFHLLFLPTLYQALGKERRIVFLLDEFDVLDLSDKQDLIESAAARAFRPYLYQLLTMESSLSFVFVVGRHVEELSADFLSAFKAALRLQVVSILHPEETRTLILQAEHEGVLRYDKAAIERIMALTRGHPFLTQLTCQILYDHCVDISMKTFPEISSLVSIEDIKAIIPTVLEAGDHAFQWIWEGLPSDERIIFSALASQAGRGTIFSKDDIINILVQKANIRISTRQLDLALQTLMNLQMLEHVDDGYRFFAELMHLWVVEQQPLDKVKDERERINLADNLFQTAQNFYRQGDNERAMDWVRQAVEANPKHYKAQQLLDTVVNATKTYLLPTNTQPSLKRWQQIYFSFAMLLALAVMIIPLFPKQATLDTSDLPIIYARPPTPIPPTHEIHWISEEAMPTKRAGLGLVTFDGKIFAIGGVKDNNQATRSVEIYDPTINRWNEGANKPTAAANMSGVAVGDKIYVPGGCTNEGRAIASLEIYKPKSDSWDKGQPLPEARCSYGLVALQDKLYLFGGWNGLAFEDTVFVYSIKKDEWEVMKSVMPQAKGYVGAAVLNEAIYIAGGYDGKNEYNQTYVFEPETGAWQEKALMQEKRGGLGLVAAANNLYAVGGGWQKALTTSEKYDPTSDTWTAFETPFINQWRDMGLAWVDTKIYAVGGWNGTDKEYMDSVVSYQFLYQLFLPVSSSK